MKRFFLLTAIACSLATSFAQTTLTEAADFQLMDTQGNSWKLTEILSNDQYLCLSFYTANCCFCQEATPKISEAYEYFGSNAAQVIFLGINFGNDLEEVAAFSESWHQQYPVVPGVGGGTALCELYDIQAFPTIILIAPDRKIVEPDIWPIPTAQTITTLFETYRISKYGQAPGIGKKYEGPILLLSPNPATTTMSVVCKLEPDMSVSYLEVVDLNGKRTMMQALLSEEQLFDVSEWAEGTYLVSVVRDGKRILSQKITVVHEL